MQNKNLTMVLEAGSYITNALRELKKVRTSIQSGVSGDTHILERVKAIEKELNEARDKVIELTVEEQG